MRDGVIISGLLHLAIALLIYFGLPDFFAPDEFEQAIPVQIVNIADVYGFQPLRHHLAYSVSKAALIAATRALAVELAPEVRVNAVAPGIALFPPAYDEAKRRRLLDRTLLKVEGGAGEIARTVRFLLEGVETMTGQVLVVDGGRLAGLEA